MDERQNKSRDQNVSLRNGAHHLDVEHRRAAVAVDDAQIRGRIKFIAFWSCLKKFLKFSIPGDADRSLITFQWEDEEAAAMTTSRDKSCCCFVVIVVIIVLVAVLVVVMFAVLAVAVAVVVVAILAVIVVVVFVVVVIGVVVVEK